MWIRFAFNDDVVQHFGIPRVACRRGHSVPVDFNHAIVRRDDQAKSAASAHPVSTNEVLNLFSGHSGKKERARFSSGLTSSQFSPESMQQLWIPAAIG